jgi:hypothetical protein
LSTKKTPTILTTVQNVPIAVRLPEALRRSEEMANIFEGEDPYPGADGIVRRSLSQLGMEHTAIRKLSSVLQSLKIRHLSPFWMNGDKVRNGFTAHFYLTDYKVAIFTQSVKDSKRAAMFREACEKWSIRPMLVLRGDIDRMSVENLSRDLSDAVGIKVKRK